MSGYHLSPKESGQKSRYDEYRSRVAGTTIDERTLLSTDYFNSFNEVVMLLGLVADMPEMLDDVRAWKFRTYEEHFRESGLAFGELAIEAYTHSPPDVRKKFEQLINELRQVIDEAQKNLAPASTENDLRHLKLNATGYSTRLQNLIEAGSSIIHASNTTIDQDRVDKMF